MILSKNRLKKLKKTIDDDDMLNYLKYSHLDTPNKNMNKSLKINQLNFQKLKTNQHKQLTQQKRVLILTMI